MKLLGYYRRYLVASLYRMWCMQPIGYMSSAQSKLHFIITRLRPSRVPIIWWLYVLPKFNFYENYFRIFSDFWIAFRLSNRNIMQYINGFEHFSPTQYMYSSVIQLKPISNLKV